MNNRIKLKLLYNDADVPKYKTEMAAGMDLSAYLDDLNQHIEIRPGERKLVMTGLSMDIPKGIEMQIRPRSWSCFEAWHYRTQFTRNCRC
ncbi:dUTP pyrophosphatase [Thermoactinomyces sp. DSM 45892]|nr:dUTP pyrophosphatase [Thermoactinomyces sp. DSM 45892]